MHTLSNEEREELSLKLPQVWRSVSDFIFLALACGRSSPMSADIPTGSVRSMGGDLGGGRSPKIWGGGTAHASIPNIWRNSVMLDVLESTKSLKKREMKEFFVK